MENVKSSKLTSNVQIQRITVSALMIAIAVLLPQIIHMVAGKALGSVLLPMHLPVLLAGFIIGRDGKKTGLAFVEAVALMAPVASFFATGMPAIPTLWLMMFELSAYGLVSAIMYGKTKKIYLSLASALIAGRIVNAAVLFVGGNLIGLKLPAVTAVWTAIITGLPGIIIQLLLIPVLVKALEKAGRHID